MMGFQIYERRSVLVDDFDPDEMRVDKDVPVSLVYLDEEECKEELERLKTKEQEYNGNPISCYSYSKGYYIKPVTIKE